MGTDPLQLLRHVHVILEVVLVALGVEDVARIADRRLADCAAVFQHGLHGRHQVGHVVEAVEDAKDVHPGIHRVLDEAGDHVVRIIRVAYRVGTPQQHLEADIGDALAQLRSCNPE